MSTVRAVLAEARERLSASESAALDAEILLSHALGRGRSFLYANPESLVPPDRLAGFRGLVERRRAGEPIAYLTGRREFWSLSFEVNPDVLIPRPETETLVELALRLIPPHTPWRVADLGTGCGAIALAIASERPRCEIHAVDISAPALRVARRNARRLGLEHVHFHAGAWCAPLAGEFQLIASNPPYVAPGDPHLSSGDCRFEPAHALSPPTGALDCLEAVAAEARKFLAGGGWLLLEHGAEQGPAVRNLLAGLSYENVTTDRDLAGHERVTRGQAGRSSH